MPFHDENILALYNKIRLELNFIKRFNVLQQDHVRLDLNLPLMIEFKNLKSLVIFVYLQVVDVFILPFKC